MRMIWTAFGLVLTLTFLTGIVYPLAMTGLAQAFFPVQANGSIVERDGKMVGSLLIGQGFAADKYFCGRPSAAGENGYDASASGGSNLGPTSKKLHEQLQERLSQVRKQNNLPEEATVPADLVTASGSGLDPEISLASAYLQIDRIAGKRNLAPGQVRKLVDASVRSAQLGLLGEARVNVLELNLALDSLEAENQVK